jgi:putative transposase
MTAVAALPADISVRGACDALGLSRATIYRSRSAASVTGTALLSPPRRVRPIPPRRLGDAERAAVIALLHSDEFADQPPREIVAGLLSEGRYLCSVRTMYRILASLGESEDRRAQRNHASYEPPFVRATAPNEVWVWDITALPGPTKGHFYYLYAVMDLYSRFVVAWQVAHAQSGDLAERLFVDACATYDIAPTSLCVHSDRGSPMTSYRLTLMFEQLGVAPSYSRPRVSDDNPHIESHFKTLKYQPEFPSRFQSFGAASAWCDEHYGWYNYAHHHAGIALYTPANVFFGEIDAVCAARQSALDRAYAANPERFVRGRPIAARPPTATEINPADLITPEEANSAQPSRLPHVRQPNGKVRRPQPQLMLPIS